MVSMLMGAIFDADLLFQQQGKASDMISKPGYLGEISYQMLFCCPGTNDYIA